MTEDGWQQIRAGTSLVAWSRLAHWNAQALCFAPAEQQDFESNHKGVHATYGRLICWLAFAVGAEYLCKGVCLLKGLPVYKQSPQKVIRPPLPGEDLECWISLVTQKDPSVQQEDRCTKTLGQMVDEVAKIAELGKNRDRVVASMKLLASTIRNRDAHRYAQNVRSFHFHAIPDLRVYIKLCK